MTELEQHRRMISAQIKREAEATKQELYSRSSGKTRLESLWLKLR